MAGGLDGRQLYPIIAEHNTGGAADWPQAEDIVSDQGQTAPMGLSKNSWDRRARSQTAVDSMRITRPRVSQPRFLVVADRALPGAAPFRVAQLLP